MSVIHIAGIYFLFPHNKRIRAVDSTICFVFFFSSISAIHKMCNRASALHLGSRELYTFGTYAPCCVVITNYPPEAIFLKLCIYYVVGLHLPESQILMCDKILLHSRTLFGNCGCSVTRVI